ncbi:flagellar assembly protein FliH [Lentibacillus saliphilus]|uniref:flagellar assembly protein FliH n=1 Tax=Lentibacillus saliphilus TaxID=2737028 RepID=UPI001C2FD9A7|nr:flagellar assembly protein FliH [Lentibacillus saliphilus]
MSNAFTNGNHKEKIIGIKKIHPKHHEREFAEDNDQVDVITTKENELQQLVNRIENLKAEEQKLITQTKASVEKERAAWETEKQQLMLQAKEQGYQAGYNAGEQEAMNTYHERLTKANTLIEQSRVDYHATVSKSEDAIIHLAMKTAEKIICQKLDEHPESYGDIVKSAIQELKSQTVISVYLHPDNYEHVLKQKEELSNLINPKAQLSIYVSSDLTKHNCLIEHPYGQIDVGVDTQLKQIRHALQEKVMEQSQ